VVKGTAPAAPALIFAMLLVVPAFGSPSGLTVIPTAEVLSVKVV
jgi:hypothetical protein